MVALNDSKAHKFAHYSLDGLVGDRLFQIFGEIIAPFLEYC